MQSQENADFNIFSNFDSVQESIQMEMPDLDCCYLNAELNKKKNNLTTPGWPETEFINFLNECVSPQISITSYFSFMS